MSQAISNVKQIGRAMYREFSRRLSEAEYFQADATRIEEALRCLGQAQKAIDETTATFWIERAISGCTDPLD
jgi:hypothetical protein